MSSTPSTSTASAGSSANAPEPVGRSLTRYNFESFSPDGSVREYISLESAGAARTSLTPNADVRIGAYSRHPTRHQRLCPQLLHLANPTARSSFTPTANPATNKSAPTSAIGS